MYMTRIRSLDEIPLWSNVLTKLRSQEFTEFNKTRRRQI